MSKDTPELAKKNFEAIPIPLDTLKKAHLELKELPVAVFPAGKNETEAVMAPPVKEQVREPKRPVLPKADGASQGAEARAPAPEKRTPVTEARSTPAVETRTPAFQQPPKAPEKGASINRKALESTNRGKSPSSRSFVRGILHPSPVKVILAAFFAIVVRVALLGAVILGVLILLDKVDLRLAWGLLALPVLALFHFATVGKVRCRVCGVKEFVPSGALKHVKTHRFLLLGPIVSTALHVLIFKWFHCMFCGTAVRIKK